MFARSRLAALGAFLVVCCVAAAQDRQPLALVADKKDLTPDGTVIVLNNCNCSDKDLPEKARYPDNSGRLYQGNEWLIGQDHLDPLTPVTLRSPRAPVKGPVELRLVNGAADGLEPAHKVRVFRALNRPDLDPKKKIAYPSVLGPRKGAVHSLGDDDLARLEKEDLLFYVEGLAFGVSAKLELWQGGSKKNELPLYTAPFLLVPHTQAPRCNYVVRVPVDKNQPINDRETRKFVDESYRYVDEFGAKCRLARAESPNAHDLAWKVVPSWDVWVEDELQWGYTETPRRRLDVALHMYRNRELAEHVRALLGPDVGYFRAFDYSKGNTHDSPNYGGNLEVTPPTSKYPFGRVYYGSERSLPDRYPGDPGHVMADGFREFFKRQKRHPANKEAAQEPIELCTDWLSVGHVDEMVSFVPADPAKYKKGFVLLWASPKLGIQLLTELQGYPEWTDPNYLDSRYQEEYGCATVQELLDFNPKTRPIKGGFSFLIYDLKLYNDRVDKRIWDNVLKIKEALDLSDDEIKPIPVLFCNGRREGGKAFDKATQSWTKSYVPVKHFSAEALTPGMVNLSSMGNVSMVPDPFIPKFREKIVATLQAVGQRVAFIDDWTVYHIAVGEVHCGSNMLRRPFDKPKWWEERR